MNRFLLFLSMVAFLHLPIWAYDIEEDGLYYEIIGANEVSVTYGDKAYSGVITIPASVSDNGISYRVTTIGSFAFSGSTGLTEIIIDDSVTAIGGFAFYGCTGLMTVTLPFSLTTIGAHVFENCTSLTDIFIPYTVMSISSYMFSGCVGLTEIMIHDNVTYIGGFAFKGCTGLTEITIPDEVIEIGENVFDGCTMLTEATIGKSVMTIDEYAFNGCESLMEINSKNTTPPTIYSNTFDGVDKEACALNVPNGCKEIYSTTDYWEEFLNINDGTTGITKVAINSDKGDVEIASEAGAIVVKGENVPVYVYDINGILLYQGVVRQEAHIVVPVGKIYLVKAGDTTKRIFVNN